MQISLKSSSAFELEYGCPACGKNVWVHASHVLLYESTAKECPHCHIGMMAQVPGISAWSQSCRRRTAA